MDYFYQNGGKKKITKTESNSLKSKKSGVNSLEDFSRSMKNLEKKKVKKAKSFMKKGGFCTLMTQDEKEERAVKAFSGTTVDNNLLEYIYLEEEFREICVEKQDNLKKFERDIDEIKKIFFEEKKQNYPTDKLKKLYERWAEETNIDMKKKLKEFIKVNHLSSDLLNFFQEHYLNNRFRLCYTKEVEERASNQPYNSRTIKKVVVIFNFDGLFKEGESVLKHFTNSISKHKPTPTSKNLFNKLFRNPTGNSNINNNKKNADNNNHKEYVDILVLNKNKKGEFKPIFNVIRNTYLKLLTAKSIQNKNKIFEDFNNELKKTNSNLHERLNTRTIFDFINNATNPTSEAFKQYIALSSFYA